MSNQLKTVEEGDKRKMDQVYSKLFIQDDKLDECDYYEFDKKVLIKVSGQYFQTNRYLRCNVPYGNACIDFTSTFFVRGTMVWFSPSERQRMTESDFIDEENNMIYNCGAVKKIRSDE